MASVQLRREESLSQQQDSPRSPEAQVGLKVEDIWDVLEPQLSANEKLNACFESIPVSAFPQNSSQGLFVRLLQLYLIIFFFRSLRQLLIEFCYLLYLLLY